MILEIFYFWSLFYLVVKFLQFCNMKSGRMLDYFLYTKKFRSFIGKLNHFIIIIGTLPLLILQSQIGSLLHQQSETFFSLLDWRLQSAKKQLKMFSFDLTFSQSCKWINGEPSIFLLIATKKYRCCLKACGPFVIN